MQPLGGCRKATAMSNARIARSRFMRLLTTARQSIRSIDERGPADDTPGIQVKNDGQIQPALACPDVGYVSRPFLVRGIHCPTVVCLQTMRGGREILIQQIGSDVKGMIAVGRSLEFSGPDNLYVIVPHQAPHTPVADLQPQFLQLFSHPRAAVALQAETMLVTNMGQDHHIIHCPAVHVYMHERGVAADTLGEPSML